jgi:hypothetical protein
MILSTANVMEALAVFIIGLTTGTGLGTTNQIMG